MSDNVISLGERLKQRKLDKAIGLMDVLIPDDLWLALDSEAVERFQTLAEQQAFLIGAAWSIGYYGHEIERGLQDE